MIYFIYNLLWTISLPFLAAYALIKRSNSSRRLGTGLPPCPGDKEESIWVHALSVGEVISARPLVKRLRERYPEKRFVLTVKTLQGMKIAEDDPGPGVDSIFFMPLDFRWSIERLVQAIRPVVMILVETDIWPGLIYCLKKRGVRIILVNGRISPGAAKNYRRFGFIAKRILNDMELFLMQSELDSERLLRTGVSPDKVKTVGNIKFDREWTPMYEDERDRWFSLLNLAAGSRVILAGSTHEGEEEIILEAFKGLRKIFPDIKLVIAPRRIERAKTILNMGIETGLNALLRTDPDLSSKPEYDVLILDTLGELERLYGIAEISFVGGSMAPIGGHNLLEPASFGRPVLFGEHTHNFVLMSHLLLQAGGGRKVKDPEELFMALKELLSNPQDAEEMGRMAGKFVKDNSGALDRTMDYLGGYIE